MSESITDDRAKLPYGTSEPLNQTRNPSSGSSTATVSRKRRYSQARKNVGSNSNLSIPDEGSSAVQELAEVRIDDFGSGLIEYARICKEEIVSLKMTRLDVVRRYIVWSKIPLSLLQKINPPSVFLYLDAYYPDLFGYSERSSPATLNHGAVNVNLANPNQHSLSWPNNNSIVSTLSNKSFAPVGASNFEYFDPSNHTIPVVSAGVSNPNIQNFNPSSQTIPTGNHVASGLGRTAQPWVIKNPNSIIRPIAGMNSSGPTQDHNFQSCQDPSTLQ